MSSTPSAGTEASDEGMRDQSVLIGRTLVAPVTSRLQMSIVWTHAYIYNLLIQLFVKDGVRKGFLRGGTRRHTDPKDASKR